MAASPVVAKTAAGALVIAIVAYMMGLIGLGEYGDEQKAVLGLGAQTPPPTTTAPPVTTAPGAGAGEPPTAAPEAAESAKAQGTPPVGAGSGEGPMETEGPVTAYPRLDAVSRKSGFRMWSSEELKLHKGKDVLKPLLLAIMGEVYDVGTGAQFYSPGKGYHDLAGGDQSRLFADMEQNETDLSNVEHLDASELKGVLGWHEFYRDHETYRFVGYVDGRYYDAAGKPTDENIRVQKLRKAQDEGEEYKKKLRQRFIGCNSRHTGGGHTFELWCDNSYHPRGSEPIHLYWMPPGHDPEDKPGWCACLPQERRAKADADAEASAGVFKLVNYPECAVGKQHCLRPRTAPNP